MHESPTTVQTVAPTVSARKRLVKRRGTVHGPNDPDACTDGAVFRDGSVQTVDQKISEGGASEVQYSVRDGRTDVNIVKDPAAGSSSLASQPVPVPSDAQLLYWTLVDDGALPDGYLPHFVLLMNSVEAEAARQASPSFLGNPQADLFVHKFHQNKNGEATQERSAADVFAQAFALPPKRYKTRLERTLCSGPTPRKDAEDLE